MRRRAEHILSLMHKAHGAPKLKKQKLSINADDYKEAMPEDVEKKDKAHKPKKQVTLKLVTAPTVAVYSSPVLPTEKVLLQPVADAIRTFSSVKAEKNDELFSPCSAIDIL